MGRGSGPGGVGGSGVGMVAMQEEHIRQPVVPRGHVPKDGVEPERELNVHYQ